MEEKAKALRISLIILILSVILCLSTLLICCDEVRSILFSIYSGILGSALVTTLIYLTEYKVSRKNALECYWQEAGYLITLFDKIRYYYIGIDESAIKEKIGKFKTKEERQLLRADFVPVTHTDESTEIENWKNELISIISNDYRLIAEYRFDKLESAFGEIFFFAGNNKRAWIYNNIHVKLRDTHRKIFKEFYYNFERYLKGDNTDLFANIIRLNKLQREFFREETVEENVIAYREQIGYINVFSLEMENNLEMLRTEVVYPREVKRHVEKEYNLVVYRNKAHNQN